MIPVEVTNNLTYNISGEREAEAAEALAESLTALNKRRNAYLGSSFDSTVQCIAETYSVEIRPAI